MKLIPYKYKYSYMPISERGSILSDRSVCSISPAQEQSDYFYTGNGVYWVQVKGDPYNEEIIVTHEKLYEPRWKETPLPPDLRPYLADIRKYVKEGRPELADKLIDKAQKDAGYDKYMNLDANVVYPIGSLMKHKAFSLHFTGQEKENTYNYLRYLDMLTGKVTSHWETDDGVFSCETFAAFEGDKVLTRLTGPEGKLDYTMELGLPGGKNIFGESLLKDSKIVVDCNDDMITISCGYNPEYGSKGYVGLLRFIPEGGKIEITENGAKLTGGTSIVIVSRTIKIEDDFVFGCEKTFADTFIHEDMDFDKILSVNEKILGEKMQRSQLKLGDPKDIYLSGEELLKQCHRDKELDPMFMDKLYDMGRFYQIVDTGEIPPMWGQHNINTNLQVCAGNNTGLFEEMDVYFRYYETKFDDFRKNAELLFGARGLLASVHCDYDSGLYYHFSRTYPHYCWTGCLGWIYNEFWGYYLCTGDEDFLRNRVVPALKEIALFFEDYACDRDENGKVIFYPSFSPEDPTPNPGYETVTCKSINPTRINSVMDIAICREVLQNLLEACNILNIEQENISKWEKQLADLPDYILDEEGGLKEWEWADIEENYNHRHVSHHYDLWPGRVVTPEREPELAEAILISNRKRGQQDDSAHGIIHRAFCAIRLKDMEETMQNMTQLINHGFVRRNLSTAHFPYRGQFPDLQGAMPALLLEMCVFSETGVVELLPAMPEYFETGSIEGIWLYTWAKLDKMSWDTNCIKAEIISDKAQTLTIRNRKNGARFFVDGKCIEKASDYISVDVVKGQKIFIEVKF